MRSSPTPKWSPGKIWMTFSSSWTNAVAYFRKWGRRCMTRGTRILFYVPSPIEYERVLTASYERRDFGLDGIRHRVHTM